MTSSSKSILAEDRSPNAEVKETQGRLWKAVEHKELSEYTEAREMIEFDVDTVHDMEEVLSDSFENGGAGFVYANRGSPSQSHMSYWSSGSNILTPQEDGLSQQVEPSPKIDGIEVVGAKQKKGGTSIEEKLVGVKEYTVYQIRVWSGIHQWEIERRYRDFIHLYHQLKGMFVSQNDRQLPSPWENVEIESRKIFGMAPNLVEERSTLIQECLWSLIKGGSPFDTAAPLIHFLLPEKASNDPALEAKESVNMQHIFGEKVSNFQFRMFDFLSPMSYSGKIVGEDKQRDTEPNSSFGKTIRLVVQIHPCKPLKQLLEAQHYLCAGCYKNLDLPNGLIQGFVQNLVLGKPRLCEYTGQLFCTSCHSNETAVLPARVLQLWDFTPCPVSQLAKTYLDSIYDQPMLCVRAINPHIFSKVPILEQTLEMRMKLSKMFALIRCPAQESIQQSLGSRSYLLESSDFFSLHDLVDLSKSPFSGVGHAVEFLKALGDNVRASIYPSTSIPSCNSKLNSLDEEPALPILMEDVLKKMHIHITQLCSICYSEGKPCGAGLRCLIPSSHVFPFQEEDVIRCHSCGLLYHQFCFENLSSLSESREITKVQSCTKHKEFEKLNLWIHKPSSLL
ncbi:hypothetical protein SUGI_0033090 [Cryptomeria japonica]|nr:hypothetical protein SUGI_0033090 [Cryptomeria japonica]